MLCFAPPSLTPNESPVMDAGFSIDHPQPAHPDNEDIIIANIRRREREAYVRRQCRLPTPPLMMASPGGSYPVIAACGSSNSSSNDNKLDKKRLTDDTLFLSCAGIIRGKRHVRFASRHK
jgi:hypothetical protein